MRVENALAFEPERSPGIGKAAKKSRDWISEKARHSIEGIGHLFLNPGYYAVINIREFLSDSKGHKRDACASVGGGHKRINYAKASLIRDACASVVNTEIPTLLSGSVICRTWGIQCTKQE